MIVKHPLFSLAFKPYNYLKCFCEKRGFKEKSSINSIAEVQVLHLILGSFSIFFAEGKCLLLKIKNTMLE